jgi:hypothetical protein
LSIFALIRYRLFFSTPRFILYCFSISQIIFLSVSNCIFISISRFSFLCVSLYSENGLHIQSIKSFITSVLSCQCHSIKGITVFVSLLLLFTATIMTTNKDFYLLWRKEQQSNPFDDINKYKRPIIIVRGNVISYFLDNIFF